MCTSSQIIECLKFGHLLTFGFAASWWVGFTKLILVPLLELELPSSILIVGSLDTLRVFILFFAAVVILVTFLLSGVISLGHLDVNVEHLTSKQGFDDEPTLDLPPDEEFRPLDRHLSLFISTLDACLVTQLFLRLILNSDKKPLWLNDWVDSSMCFCSCCWLLWDVMVLFVLLLEALFPFEHECSCCRLLWDVMVLDVLLLEALFPIENDLLAGFPQVNTGLEQLSMAFPVRLLSQTKLDFDLEFPFEFIKPDLGFISSLDPESTQEDFSLKTLTGCGFFNKNSWFSALHFLLLYFLPLDLETDGGSFGEVDPCKSTSEVNITSPQPENADFNWREEHWWNLKINSI